MSRGLTLSLGEIPRLMNGLGDLRSPALLAACLCAGACLAAFAAAALDRELVSVEVRVCECAEERVRTFVGQPCVGVSGGG